MKANSPNPSAFHPFSRHAAAQPCAARAAGRGSSEKDEERDRAAGAVWDTEEEETAAAVFFPFLAAGFTALRSPCTAPTTATPPSFDPATTGKPRFPLAFATRALAPWPPSPARPKHHLALFSHARCALARSHAAQTRVWSKARPLLSRRESRSGSAYARSPRTRPGRRHERTLGESQKRRLSRTTRSPRTHAAYALSTTRRTCPNWLARGREHHGHARSWDALRSGRCAPLESPKPPLELSPCSRTHRARAVIEKEARERRGRGTAVRPPWPAPAST